MDLATGLILFCPLLIFPFLYCVLRDNFIFQHAYYFIFLFIFYSKVGLFGLLFLFYNIICFMDVIPSFSLSETECYFKNFFPALSLFLRNYSFNFLSFLLCRSHCSVFIFKGKAPQCWLEALLVSQRGLRAGRQLCGAIILSASFLTGKFLRFRRENVSLE